MIFWLFLFLVTVAEAANPFRSPDICGRPKCAPSTKFSYKEGSTYQYQYSIDVITLFKGTSTNESTLHIDALCSVEFLTRCEGILKLQNVTLKEWASMRNFDDSEEEEGTVINDPNNILPQEQEFRTALEKHEIRFSFHDGVINEVCPDPGEENWVLNFKKGIISALQNSMDRFDVDYQTSEADVAGQCDTEYSLHVIETDLVLKKVKDISTCTSRYNHHSAIQTTPYIFKSKYQSLPVMKSTSYCEQAVDNKIYKNIFCEEKHLFQPFSNKDMGATTITKQNLQYLMETNTTTSSPEPITRRTSLLFEHLPKRQLTTGDLRSSRDLLKKLCELSLDEVKPEFPRAFANFIHTSRILSYPALSQLVARSSVICDTGRKNIMDALPLMGTAASVSVMKDLITREEVQNELLDEWLLTLAFIPRPDIATVSAAAPLLKSGVSEKQTLLSVSALVHSYCRWNTDCKNENEVLEIVAYLESFVQMGCQEKPNKRQPREKVLIALKALGNIGIPTSTLTQSLQLCVEDTNMPIEIRIAAIEAHRRLPCEVERDYFLNIFSNMSVDSELRIAAYLEVMKCPTYLTVKALKHSLEQEDVNQVGAFVWSHMQNLQKSSIPSKIEIQGLLTDQNLKRKFSQDIRKFSHNYENSIFYDEYNVGGSVENNVIFSPKSYIPRSANFNVTVDLFGESVNVFEVGGRVEGFEHYIESIFGLNGPISNKVVKEKLEHLRYTRSTDTIQEIKNEINQFPNVVEHNYNVPKASLSLKIFGNELKYSSFVGDEIKTALESIDPVRQLKQLSGKEVNYEKSTMFLDAIYIVPTGTGLPLNLNAVGTAGVNLKMSGTLKADNFLRTGEMDIESKMRPSIAVDVVGTMGVDAFYAKTGIKLKANLYSSNAVEGQIKIQGSKLVRISFDLQKEKTEIFSAESELVVLQRDEEKIQEGIKDGRVEAKMCTWPALVHAVGLKLCGDFQFPNATHTENAPPLLLSGPSKFQVVLLKTDPSADKYLLEYNWNTTEDRSLISLTFDTPGSDVKRELSAKLDLHKQSQDLTISLQSPQSRFEAKGKFKNTESEKNLELGLDINGQKRLDAQVGLKRSETKHGFTYQPRLYLAINNDKLAELSGTLKWADKKGVSQYDVNLDFRSKKISTKIDGYVRKTDASIATNIRMEYTVGKSQQAETVKLETKLSNQNSKSLAQSHGNLQLESSAYPQLNFIGSLKYQRAQGHIESKIEINSNPDLDDDAHKLTILQVFTYWKTYEGSKMNTTVHITKPISNIDLKFGFNHHVMGSSRNSELLLRYSPGKDIRATVSLEIPRGSLLYLEGKLNISLPSMNPFFLAGRLHEKAPKEYDIELSGTWFSGDTFSVQGSYHNRSSGKLFNRSLKLLLRSNMFEDIAVSAKIFRNDKEIKLEFQTEYIDSKYSIMLKHETLTEREMVTHVEFRNKNSVYSLTSSIHLHELKQIILELHIDKYRDIYIALKGANEVERKEAGFEIKWDANRDPGQKFGAMVSLYHPAPLNYSGNLLLSYPGRTIKGGFHGGLQGINYKSSASIEWSPEDVVGIQCNFIYDEGDHDISWRTNIELITPFQNWKKTSFSAGFTISENSLQANNSVHWSENDYVKIDLSGIYTITNNIVEIGLNGSFLSSIPGIETMAGTFHHKQDSRKFETDLKVEYDPQKFISVQSEWILSRNDDDVKITGNLKMASPYKGYEVGDMSVSVYMNKESEIGGNGQLDFDGKKYKMDLTGHLRSLTNYKILVNIETPIPKYHKITGHFGFSKSERHFIATIKWPSDSLGLEVHLNLISFTLFDVKFQLGSPFEFLSQLLLVGIVNKDKIEMRAGWNNVNIGFSGVWRYESDTDFEFSFKIFTPVKGFEENGAVAKLVIKDVVNVDFSVIVADVKLGIKAEGGPKYPNIASSNQEDQDVSSPADYDDTSEEALFNWKGLLEIDTILYPTMRGKIDIDERGTVFYTEASLTLPDGTATLYDELDVEDYFTITNKLHLVTPCECFKEVHSNFRFGLVPDEVYGIALDAKVNNGGKWSESFLLVNYTIEQGSEGRLIRSGRFNIESPFEFLNLLDLEVSVETGENYNGANITLKTMESDFATGGHFMNEENVKDASFHLNIASPYYTLQPFSVYGKMDFSDPEKQVKLILNLPRKDGDKTFRFESAWQYTHGSYLKARANIESPYEQIKSISGSVLFEHNRNDEIVNFELDVMYQLDREVKISGQLKPETITVELKSPLEHFRDVKFSSALEEVSPGVHSFSGNVKSGDVTLSIRGHVKRAPDVPLELNGTVTTPFDGMQEIIIFTLISAQPESFLLESKVEYGGEKINAKGEIKSNGPKNWEMDVDVDTTNPAFDEFSWHGKVGEDRRGNVSAELKLRTPFKGLSNIKLSGSLLKPNDVGALRAAFDLEHTSGTLLCDWTWKYMEDMSGKVIMSYNSEDVKKHLASEMYFRNPEMKFRHVSAGFDVNLNRKEWEFGANSTVQLIQSPEATIEFTLNLKVPSPQPEIYSIANTFQYSPNFRHVAERFGYTTANSEKKYLVFSEISRPGNENNVVLRFEWDKDTKVIENKLNLTLEGQKVDALYILTTPRYKEDTVVLNALYDKVAGYHRIKGDCFIPASNHITTIDANYKNFWNMHGMLNVTSPFKTLPYTGVNFRSITHRAFQERYFELFWPNNSAFFHSKYTMKQVQLTSQVNGSVNIEIPLEKRHVGKILYEYVNDPQNTTGTSSVEYNNSTFLKGKYERISHSSAGLDRDVSRIEVENKFAPMGVVYLHQHEYSGGTGGLNLPTTETDRVEVFSLRKEKPINITGEMVVKTTFTGKEIKLKAIHPNRTVELDTEYNFLDHEFTQNSTLYLDPHTSIGYDLTIINQTTDMMEKQLFELNIAYPLRNFAIHGNYELMEGALQSELSFNWDRTQRNKTIGSVVGWKRISSEPNEQEASVSVKHPSLARDVVLTGRYFSNKTTLLQANVELEYCNDINKRLTVSGNIKDESNSTTWKYSGELLANHRATRLDLNAAGWIMSDGSIHETQNFANYKRSYLPLMKGIANAKLNSILKEIKMEKSSPSDYFFASGKYTPKYPVYRIDGNNVQGRNFNATGEFFINLEELVVQLNVNLTPDASENLQMIGKIPDSRNAVYNIWRQYDNTFISDVAFYLKLNHSRLVTSKLTWRPELKSDIMTGIENAVDSLWNDTADSLNYWKHTINYEVKDIMKDVWRDSKPYIKTMLDDMEELKQFENDLEELKIFINNSYHENEFYMKDIIQLSLALINELSLRDYLETLPEFIEEFWHILGESGEAVKRSIIWIIEAMKEVYKQLADLITSFMKGDSSIEFSEIFEKLFAHYDKLSKDLHYAFTKYVDEVCEIIYDYIYHYWQNIHETLHPLFLKFLHYLETGVWNAGRELLDFLYEKQSEIVESTFYTQLANFTHDLDTIYKDFTKNDTFTNIKKYSKIIFDFLKKKYFDIVPFGRELHDLLTELWEDVKEIQKQPAVSYIIQLFNDAYSKVLWFYEYFDIETKIQHFLMLFHLKVSEITQTALEAENKYREAKTKFIFEPESGIVLLEQKLPMSWHAFNETPQFEEIPEYKAFLAVQDYFSPTNFTFWSFYYEYEPYFEVENWLPPFTAHSLIAGQQHFMTFDKQFYEFRGKCTYLLAHDFLDGNFSLIIKYDAASNAEHHEIILIMGDDALQIDVFTDSVRLYKEGHKQLPVQFGDTYIYQEGRVVTIESDRGLTIKCNLKFDICSFSLSGWYYGKTAGLLGTIDNEPVTDFLTSNRVIEMDVARFAHSWAIETEGCTSIENVAIEMEQPDSKILQKCESFFSSKSSELLPCFPVVDPTPFMRMCLNSRVYKENEACTTARAYMEACNLENVPLRIPYGCVRCHLHNGSELMESEFHKIEGSDILQSTDVVFIIEAKDCNRNIKEERNIEYLIPLLNNELTDAGIKFNRYAVVVFGGDGVYDQPRSVVVQNTIFASPQLIPLYFENIPVGNGSNDIFGAIRFAARLPFRAGVSKTFILFPCTNCALSEMQLDYSILHQVLLENDITLHILMKDEFLFEKRKVIDQFFGLDGKTSYTKKDIKVLRGDVDLRRQVKLPKSVLGYCTPLALETNGTVFTAKKLAKSKHKLMKKFVTVFAKRVVMTANPSSCQLCECTADNDGLSYMQCFPCTYPTPAYIDNVPGFNEDYAATYE